MPLNRTSYLAIEAGINLLSALALHAIVFSLLGTEEYSNYAVGLTIGAVASISALGIPILMPEWIARRDSRGTLLANAFLTQFIASAFFAAATAIIYALFPGIFGSGLGVTGALIIAAGVYVFAQQVDEGAHVYFRVTGREFHSLIASLLTKALILLTALGVGLATGSGMAVYKAAATILLLASVAKAISVVVLENSGGRVTFVMREVIACYREVWLGNVSNMLFNGIIRLVIGENVGKLALAMLVLAYQVSIAASSMVGAFSLRLVMAAVDNYNGAGVESVRKAKVIAFSASVFSSTATFIVSVHMFYDSNFAGLSTADILTLIAPLSTVFALSVLTIPYYQICQFRGVVRRIALINFFNAVLGTAAVLVIDYLGEARSFAALILLGIGAASAIMTIRAADFQTRQMRQHAGPSLRENS